MSEPLKTEHVWPRVLINPGYHLRPKNGNERCDTLEFTGRGHIWFDGEEFKHALREAPVVTQDPTGHISYVTMTVVVLTEDIQYERWDHESKAGSSDATDG